MKEDRKTQFSSQPGNQTREVCIRERHTLQSLDETINALAMTSPFSLEEKQVLLEAKNLEIRKTKISEILNTYTYDQFDNTTLQ